MKNLIKVEISEDMIDIIDKFSGDNIKLSTSVLLYRFIILNKSF